MTRTSSMFFSPFLLFANFYLFTFYSCDTCGKAFRSQAGLKQCQKKCQNSIVETTEIVQEEVVDHVQAVQVLMDKDGQQFFKLDDGRLMPVAEDTTIYTIEDQ